MTTRYRLRKKTDNFGETTYLIEKFRDNTLGIRDSWWPIGCYATEERALEIWETVGQEKEEIIKEKEV